MFFSVSQTNTPAYTGAAVSYPGVRAAEKLETPSGLTFSDKTKDKTLGKTEAKGECQTCKERKYVDGSNEGNVSFKAPGHIAPEASAGVVMSHEKEHVANAKREGNKPGNELISATVSLKTAICPECGRSYVAGGTTRTLIKYGDSEYDKNKKAADLDAVLGANVDMAV